MVGFYILYFSWDGKMRKGCWMVCIVVLVKRSYWSLVWHGSEGGQKKNKKHMRKFWF